jgi:hypothetical protein
MAFSERVLKFSFSGATEGSFSAAGLRAVANIQVTEGIIGVTAQVKIWGLSMAQMNSYSSAIPQAISDEVPDANLIIEAGDLGGQLLQVIDGPIWSSYIDLTDAPESAFVVSVAGIADAATPSDSQSQPGAQPAEVLIQAICAGAGLTFNNNGAHAVLQNQATYGSALKQIDTIARAAEFHWTLNGNTISIWPQGGTVDDIVVAVGPGTTNPRMVGYPSYWEMGLIVTSLYCPDIQIGRQMNVVGSSIPKANGIWQIVGVQHNLTTMMPKGPWFTTAQLAGVDA